MTAKSFRPNVAAVIMHPTNKKVLMFRRIAKRNEKSELLSDGGQLRWNWQFPQGGIDQGESEEETLFRELEEETGADAVEHPQVHSGGLPRLYSARRCDEAEAGLHQEAI